MKIAAYQFAVSGNIIDNFEEIEKAISMAKDNSVELIIFPECALTGYPPRDIENSSCVDFELVNTICNKLQILADEKEISIILGTIYKDDAIYNRVILFQQNKKKQFYDKRALWGWDKDNFTEGNSEGVFEIEDITIGIRICFEVRFPEYFRELYIRKTDLNVVLFYDVSDVNDIERYSMIKGHLQTRAVENIATTISVNSIGPFQTAPTIVIGKSGQFIKECNRNQPEILIYDFEKMSDDFGEMGRREISDKFVIDNEHMCHRLL